MATFDNPVQSPQIGLDRQHLVSQPMSDNSTGMLLSTAGKTVDEGFKVADTAEKQGIENQLYSKVRDMQDSFISALDNTAQTKGVSYHDPMNANASMDVIPQPAGTPAVPTNVQGTIDTAAGQTQRLMDAFSAGKISRIGLDQRLYPILKDVRANVPDGYKEYVDQTMSRITGYNVANALISEKLYAINAGMSGQQKEQDYWEKQIVGSGFSGSQQVLQQFQQDHDTARVQNWLAGNNEQQSKVNNTIKAFELGSKVQDDLKQKAELAANTAAEHAATEFYYNRRLTSDDSTDQELGNKLYDYTIHPEKRDDEQIRILGQQLQYHMQRNQQETLGLLNNTYTTDPTTGKKYSIAQVLGPARVGEIVKSNIDNLYKLQMDGLNNGNLSLVGSVQKQAGDIISNNTRKVLQDNTVGGVVTTMGVLNKIAPQLSPPLMGEIYGGYTSPNKLNGGAAGGSALGRDLISTVQAQKQQAIAQTGGDPSVSPDGRYTFAQSQKEIGKVKGITPAQQGMAIKSYLGLVKAFDEKNPQVVDNATNYFFSPANQGSLNKLMDDYYDQSRGVIVKGRTGAFEQLTDPSVTASIYKRAQNGNPQGWDMYRHWATKQAESNLTDMAKTWAVNESQYKNQKIIHGAEGDIPSGTDHHFYWDSKTHQIGITDLKGNPLDIENSWRANPDIFMVRNANKTLSSISNIVKQEGGNDRAVDAYLLQRMYNAGWRDTPVPGFDVKNGSIPQRVIDAITHANQPDNIRDIKDESRVK